MTPLEIKDEKQELIIENKALKSLFGEMLLEDKVTSPEELAYYQRKFKENQEKILRNK